MAVPRIAITAGEPAGIGPDIVLLAAQQAWDAELVVIADPALLQQRAQALQLPVELQTWTGRHAATGTPRGHTENSSRVAGRTDHRRHSRSSQRGLCDRDAPTGGTRLSLQYLSGDGDRASAKIRHQRRWHSVYWTHRVSGPGDRHRPGRHDAGDTGAARGAGHHSPGAERRTRQPSHPNSCTRPWVSCIATCKANSA